ncbi:MAG: hypothetical protein HC790_05445 [Acaryochloridaceae cyanobacterium CSU_3_4]|nr:hypothetical protein [Acaryochloridaceae cyanobacterium CSU_3_4]
MLPPQIEHYIAKNSTQRTPSVGRSPMERTNDIIRQLTGRWHRRQNKFGKLSEQSKVTT